MEIKMEINHKSPGHRQCHARSARRQPTQENMDHTQSQRNRPRKMHSTEILVGNCQVHQHALAGKLDKQLTILSNSVQLRKLLRTYQRGDRRHIVRSEMVEVVET